MNLLMTQRGETLIEVIIAATIIAITSASALTVANQTYRLAIQARERTEAIYNVQDQAEKLRALRDRKMQDPLTPPTPLFTFANGLGCAPSCHMNNVGALVSGDTSVSRYTLKIENKNLSPSTQSVRYKISAEWLDASSRNDASTVPATTELNVFLLDKRTSKPIDCSDAGNTSC